MKNPLLRRLVPPVPYFLSCMFLLLGFLLPARAVQDLTAQAPIGTSSGGTMSFLSGVYTMTATGLGIGLQLTDPDSGLFAYKPLVTGDIEIVARVASFTGGTEAQVGLTIRAGTGATDQIGSFFFIKNWHASAPANENTFMVRTRGPAVDGLSYYYDEGGQANFRPTVSAPFWLKLVRIGNNYGYYWSPDGREWFLNAETSGNVFFPTTYNVGLFVSSNSGSTSATATFDNVYVGAPRMKYKTSWVGATSGGRAAGNPANQINALWVKPDGTCYANSNWDEGGGAGTVYKNGAVFHRFKDGINGALEGTITGDGSYLYYYNSVPAPGGVYRADFNTANSVKLTFTGPALGTVGGIASSGSQIFVSDLTNGCVRVVNASTLTEVTATTPYALPIPFPHCGPLAFDGANLWITDTASDFPLVAHVAALSGYTPAIRCYSTAGQDLSATHAPITDVAVPTALAYDNRNTTGSTTDDRLWVCDNGTNQNVRYYTNLTGNPTLGGTVGATGGIWATNPGLITAGDFYGPVGVGVDSGLNLYVACNGATGNVTDLRKFNSSGALQWRVSSHVFVHEGDFDPLNGEFYTPYSHFTMNYANTAPGTEWSYKGFTHDVRQNLPAVTDGRNPNSPLKTDVAGAKLQRVGGNLFMYTSGQGVAGASWLYRFSGENAIPFGRVDRAGAYPDLSRVWIDANNNGVVDTGEEKTCHSLMAQFSGSIQSFDVDANGDIWTNLMGNHTNGSPGSIHRIICLGTQTIGGASVPKYDVSLPGGFANYLIPAPLAQVWNINYDSVKDVLYAMGQKADGTWILTRTNNWKSVAADLASPVATWAVNLPDVNDVTMLYPGNVNYLCNGMDVAGGKIFISEVFGPIHVYDAALGNREIDLIPGPEISAKMGWEDMAMGLNAYQRSTGEYIVAQEDAGFHAADILYRWTPTADTTVSLAPTGLTATGLGHKIRLSWNGPAGMVTSYKLYRGTASGGETLYQSGITSPLFMDLNVTPGTTYYYKVTAVNAAGESTQSNEASAVAVTAQAEFVKIDTTTQGTWFTGSTPPGTTVYGSEGYDICGDTAVAPTYATVTASPVTMVDTWANPSTDIWALRKAAGTSRIAARRQIDYSTYYPTWQLPWSWNISITDGKWHQVAVYMVDGNLVCPNQRVDVVDTASGTVLDTRALGDFTQGKYAVWNVSGNVQLKFYQDPWSNFSVASGLFFDPVQPTSPSIAWWKFDATTGTIATDSSGAGHNGNLAGTAAWNASGKINGCISIPGGTARVNIPTALITGQNPVTVATWFKTSATTGAVLASYANAGSSPTAFTPILYVGTDGKLRGSYNTGTTTPSTLMSSTATVNNGAWHHVALVMDGNTQSLYLDGLLVDSHAATLTTTALNYNYIGVGTVTGYPLVGSGTNVLNGYLDDTRIYNRAIGAGEIWKLAQ